MCRLLVVDTPLMMMLVWTLSDNGLLAAANQTMFFLNDTGGLSGGEELVRYGYAC